MKSGRFVVFHRISEDGLSLERVVSDTENKMPLDISVLNLEDATVVARSLLTVMTEIHRNQREKQ